VTTRSAPPGLSRILGTKPSYTTEEAAMFRHTFVQALGQARLADLHHQAQRVALARAARRARRQQATHRAPEFLGALTRWARTWASRRGTTAATPVATAPDRLPPPERQPVA
jgi:hypothetical protein